MKEKNSSRRDFIKKSAIGAAAFSIVPRFVLGGQGYLAPSDHLTKGVIGVGNMGRGHFGYAGTKTVAICDVDKTHLAAAQRDLGGGVTEYHDFRELIKSPEVDIVHIATPPHWHGLMSIEAAKAGKDIWCEKPMTRTIGEGKKVKEAIAQHGNMFRLNTWFRFKDDFYGMNVPVSKIKKLVDTGMLGWPLKVTISKHTGFDWKFYWVGKENLPEEQVPAELDYDFWLGPAPYKPYNKHRVHTTFRGYWDYDGGGLGDMGQHYMDPVQYFLGKDNESPVSVDVDAPQQHPDAVGTWRRITFTYADGCQIILDGEAKDEKAAYIEGPNGKLYRGFKSDIPDLERKLAQYPEPAPQITDFLESVRTREKFALNEINGHRSCTLVNMGLAALRLNRSLKYDSQKEQFIDDDAANRLIDQPMRGPWSI
ncbi:Gfo/Idh/MocA family oxidoreductase [Sphingobacterium thalpophilum]|uniref:Inositol 2-dehydrogenase n=1 Tax=Sphingobacterium thalpophilum TaxID=259 RepID=A0A4U9UJA3_9SPHI|nr:MULTISPECIES: Gfo/Idh/MocA family oxidoreductase [Sphingobacterium]MCW8310304.1 Gfo/Idh/MocA family oxidoreductase [Sphingobacterium sp. InxBP1]VTR32757.1 Inositol 2-dehydrogenase [Sphingobacterium thalpophilum]